MTKYFKNNFKKGIFFACFLGMTNFVGIGLVEAMEGTKIETPKAVTAEELEKHKDTISKPNPKPEDVAAAIEAAKTGMGKDDTQYYALYLFRSLVDKKMITEVNTEDVTAIIKVMETSKDPRALSAALSLLELLNKKELITAENLNKDDVTKIINFIKESQNPYTPSHALDLLNSLVNNNKKIITEVKTDDVTAIINAMETSKDTNTPFFALRLLGSLVEKDLITAEKNPKAIPDVIKAAKDGMGKAEINALCLFYRLVDKNLINETNSPDFTAAISNATIGMQKSNTQFWATKLFNALVTKLISLLDSQTPPKELATWCKQVIVVENTFKKVTSLKSDLNLFEKFKKNFEEKYPDELKKLQPEATLKAKLSKLKTALQALKLKLTSLTQKLGALKGKLAGQH